MSRQCQTISSCNSRAAGGRGASTPFRGDVAEAKCTFPHPAAPPLGGPSWPHAPALKGGLWVRVGGWHLRQEEWAGVGGSHGRCAERHCCSPWNAVLHHLSNPAPQRPGDQQVNTLPHPLGATLGAVRE